MSLENRLENVNKQIDERTKEVQQLLLQKQNLEQRIGQLSMNVNALQSNKQLLEEIIGDDTVGKT